jgi:N-methylhydantoinase B
VTVKLTREGDTLHFDFTGSSPQVDAAVNCTFHATVAGAAVPIYTFICQGDIDWNDGVKRCLKVTAPAGTVVNASFPAPVSICTIGFRWLVTVAASQAVAKMLDASGDMRDRVCPSWSVSANCNNLFGVSAEGKRVGALLSDHRGGGAGARSFADGFSHSGQTTSFSASMANVESQEWKLPLLYLYRRQLPDSGGAGRWRGGLTAAVALTPIGVPEMVLKSTNTAGTEQSNAHGIDGGYPGAGSQVRVLHGTDVWARLQSGQIPRDDAEFGGRVEHLPSKASGTLAEGDVLVFFAPGGGGFGDPLDREPERVANDVANGWVSRERAKENYGVALKADQTADEPATKSLRDQIRGARKQRPTAAWTGDDRCEHPGNAHDGSWRVGENVDLAHDGVLHCRRCGESLTGAEGRVAVSERALSTAGPWMALRHHGDGPNFALEEISCPSCATLIAVREVRRNGGKG